MTKKKIILITVGVVSLAILFVQGLSFNEHSDQSIKARYGEYVFDYAYEPNCATDGIAIAPALWGTIVQRCSTRWYAPIGLNPIQISGPTIPDSYIVDARVIALHSQAGSPDTIEVLLKDKDQTSMIYELVDQDRLTLNFQTWPVNEATGVADVPLTYDAFKIEISTDDSFFQPDYFTLVLKENEVVALIEKVVDSN